MQAEQARVQLQDTLSVADVPTLKSQLASLEHDAASDDLWQDAAAAQALMTQISNIKSEVEDLQRCAAVIQLQAISAGTLCGFTRSTHLGAITPTRD